MISDEYKALMLKMHVVEPQWGRGGKRHYLPIVELIKQHNIKTALDFGCGLAVIGKALISQNVLIQRNVQLYDPGMPEYAAPPRPAELVICTDVLEHIEPDLLDATLHQIRGLATRIAYLHIAVGPARAILPDGRNAHLIQQPMEWWEARLREHWASVQGTLGREGTVNPTFVCE